MFGGDSILTIWRFSLKIAKGNVRQLLAGGADIANINYRQMDLDKQMPKLSVTVNSGEL